MIAPNHSPWHEFLPQRDAKVPANTPALLRPYLTHDGSLTKKLQRLSGGKLIVHVVFSGFQTVKIRGKSYRAWVRKVQLLGQGMPWLAATTQILANDLHGGARQLPFIGDKALGQVLFFRQPKLPMRRHFFIHNGHFARQTLYQWRSCNVLLDEVFLPDLLAAVCRGAKKSPCHLDNDG